MVLVRSLSRQCKPLVRISGLLTLVCTGCSLLLLVSLLALTRVLFDEMRRRELVCGAHSVYLSYLVIPLTLGALPFVGRLVYCSSFVGTSRWCC